jgi:hypothetical protein
MYVPEKDRTTIWYLKYKLFRCTVPQLRSRSIAEIELFGTLVSGDARYDRENATAMNTVMISIEKMLEYHVAGVPVAVARREDTKIIYEYIKNHLEAWAEVFRNTVNRQLVPVEDLILLDELANKVYEHARHHFDRKWVEGIMTQTLGGIMGHNFRNIMRPNQSVTVPATEEEAQGAQDAYLDKLPKRQELSEMLTNNRAGLGVRF